MEARRGSGRSPGRSSRRKCPVDDLGRFWPGAGTPKCQADGARWRQDGGHMRPRWSQDGPRTSQDGHLESQDGPRGGQDGHLEALWGAILRIVGDLGRDLCREARSIKSNNPTTFLVDFGVHGGPIGGSWGPSWAILAASWAMLADVGVKLGVSWFILGDLTVKLGPSWQDVGTKMPKMSQDRPTWEENVATGGHQALFMQAPGSSRAGRGGPLGQDF